MPMFTSSLRSRRSRASRVVLALMVSVTGLTAAGSASAVVINDPPGNNHSILTFPVRDFIHADGYLATDLVTVNVVRGGFIVGTAADLVPFDDPGTAGVFDGFIEVNHPGGVRGERWSTSTPRHARA